jgi:zinc transport system permease protein
MEILSYPFMQHALLAAFLCSVACGIIGSLVVLNRLSFLAGAVAHAAYGGIGISFMFSLPPLPCTLVFSLAASLGMAHIATSGGGFNRDEATDTAIGILWAAGMAFGIILIELTPGYAGDLMGFLFGSILAVPLSSLLVMALLDCLLLALFFYFRQGLTVLTLDAEFASARGLSVRGLFFLLVGMSSVAVVMLLQAVGLILVIALLTIPPHMARRCTVSLGAMMAVSGLLCFVFCVSGLAVAYLFDLSSGAAIIAVTTLLYFMQTVFLSRRSSALHCK